MIFGKFKGPVPLKVIKTIIDKQFLREFLFYKVETLL